MHETKRIKTVIDTNLFISFLIGKRLSGLKHALINSKIQLILSEQNINELIFVTQRPKFKKYFNNEDVYDLIDLLRTVGKVINVTDEPNICRDPKDNFLLALSEKSRADYLVTGDNDLLTIKKYKGTRIVTAETFEDLIELTNS
jgi:uncharacterized protein